MRWLVFIAALGVSYPAAHWLRNRSALRMLAWTALGFIPFYGDLDIALIAFGSRPGDTNGIEVALVDWLALVLLLSEKRPARLPPYGFAIAAYFLATAASITQAEWALGSLGYLWKLGRMLLVYAAICRAGSDPRVPAALLRGLALGIPYECAWAFWQHFGLGIHRVSGTFAHENTLGMLVNLTVMVPIALVLAKRGGWLAIVAPLAALPVSLLTVSRGTVLFLGIGAVLVYLISALRAYDLRKATFGLAGLFVALAFVPLALAVVGSRSADERERSMELRGRYEEAASMMLEEHPKGMGANQFTVALLTGGYGDRADVEWSQRVAIVHNIYWLTAAELGYLGLFALALLFLTPIVSAIRHSFRAPRDPRGDVLVGLGVALAMFALHSFFEWTWRITAVSYVHWMTVGLVAVLVRQIRDEGWRARLAVIRPPILGGATPGRACAAPRGGAGRIAPRLSPSSAALGAR